MPVVRMSATKPSQLYEDKKEKVKRPPLLMIGIVSFFVLYSLVLGFNVIQ